jgi:hypothetical protein
MLVTASRTIEIVCYNEHNWREEYLKYRLVEFLVHFKSKSFNTNCWAWRVRFGAILSQTKNSVMRPVGRIATGQNTRVRAQLQLLSKDDHGYHGVWQTR